MSTRARRRASILAAHVVAGLYLGIVFGVLYFLLEPVRGLSGDYRYVGVPLSHFFAVYVSAGAIIGVGLGLLLGMTGAVRGRASMDRSVAALAAILAGVLVVVLRMKSLRSLFASKETIGILIGLALVAAAGYLLSRLLRRRQAFRRMGVRAGSAVVLVSAATLAAAWILAYAQVHRLPRRHPSREGSPNVVLIVLDALRADHVSAYGYRRETTPNMDRLAEEGALFLNAHSHGNRTIFTMPSVFTSQYSSFLGIVSDQKFMGALPQSRKTIAEVLQDAGYTTMGLMTNVYLKTVFGMTQGFDRVEEFHAARYDLSLYRGLRKLGIIRLPRYVGRAYPPGDEVTDAAIRWLHAARDRPFLLFVHYMDTHHPYTPPPPFDTLFTDGAGGPNPAQLFEKTSQLMKEPPPIAITDEDLQRLKDYYDGAIRYADSEIGRLIEELRMLPGDRETLVVVTADHGDEFMEHGSIYHTNLLIEELIHVPLIMWSSHGTVPTVRIDALTRHIDILPTLAELTGAQRPAEAMGTSLVPLLNGETGIHDVVSIAEGDFCTSVNYRNWKIMNVDSTGATSLYDLTQVPREKEDVSDRYPEVFTMMQGHLDEHLENASLAVDSLRAAELDAESLRLLKALGYL